MSLNTFGQIIRIEPPNWWVGMNCTELQLMVYGSKIAESNVEIDYPGISILSVSRLENPNYLFINLNIDKNTRAGEFPINFTKGQKTLIYNYTLERRAEESANREGFNNSDAIYLVMPDRFANGNPDNDINDHFHEKELDRNHPYKRHGGDLEGVINHLDYIKDMGFTSLWLNPVLENNQKEGSYHGYAITDFYNVDPRFGTNEDYKKLCDQANKQGIKVIMDMVFNHCGSEHWWLKDIPSEDWINYFPDHKITNHRRTVNHDPYVAKSDLELMRDGWFVPSMPDLNQRNPFLGTYLIQNSIWWIEYLGLAGVRMDTYPYPDKYLMSDWCKHVLEEYPNINIVGEEWSTNPVTVSYWQKGKQNKDGYVSYLPSLLDFPLQEAARYALLESDDWDSGLNLLYQALANDITYPDPYNLVIFPDNHDMPRFYMQLGMNKKLYKLGITYFLTTRGIPQILYGSEILMTHTEGNDHGNIRKDFPGGWDGDTINGFTGIGLTKSEQEIQDFFKTLLNWRKDNPVIHTGKLIHYAPEDSVYVYFRYNDEKTVMVIINKNKKKYDLDLLRFSEQLGGTKTGTEIITNETLKLEKSLSLIPLTPYVIEIKN